jgi:hypothetical protein
LPGPISEPAESETLGRRNRVFKKNFRGIDDSSAPQAIVGAGLGADDLGSPPQQRGLVFLTGAGPDATIWTVVKSDPVSGQLCYSTVTPGSRAGLVTVTISVADQGLEIQVEYDLTALSAEGAASLVPYSTPHFSRMMDVWRGLIVDMLTNARPSLAALLV